MKALGLSVRVKDGWSFRSLQQMLRVGPSKLRRFVADGLLRVERGRLFRDLLFLRLAFVCVESALNFPFRLLGVLR
jgi:hypothetical protein